MSMIFFTFRAQTAAKQAVILLKKGNIPARLGKTPSHIAVNGCGYGVWVPELQSLWAVDKMKQAGLHYEKSYRMDSGGPQEVWL